jgi:hypothetical protein
MNLVVIFRLVLFSELIFCTDCLKFEKVNSLEFWIAIRFSTGFGIEVFTKFPTMRSANGDSKAKANTVIQGVTISISYK